MATITCVIKVNKDPNEYIKPVQGLMNLQRFANLVKGMEVGSFIGSASIYGSSADPVQASATITIASIANGNTVTIGKTVFTASASPSSNTATAVDFQSAGTDTVVAAALAAAINANTLGAATIVSATSSLGVVTVTALVPGVLGNQIALAKVGAPITVSGAYLANGAGGPGGAAVVLGR